MREWVIQQFEIPQRTVLNRKVPKKTFFSQGDLSKKEKELFTSQIEGIYLLSVMNRQSMNISTYQSEVHQYAEVVWIYVQLRTNQHVNRIIHAIHKSIPNPAVLIMESKEKEWLLSTCHKRLNKNDPTKVVLDEPLLTGWFHPKNNNSSYEKLLNALKCSNQSFVDLYKFYDDLNRWLQCSPIIEWIECFPTQDESRDLIISKLSEVNVRKSQLEELKQKQNHVLDFGIKMELHIEMKQIQANIESLLSELKELCD
ncbi:MAG: DUF4391 domain-containing protein [Bacillaceae bacterium]|nr:DUF4391 domain-containing protein [Bacillaceae bacterium]